MSEIDLAGAERNLWLVKVPKYMSDRWQSYGGNVGKLITRAVPSGKTDVYFDLNPRLNSSHKSDSEEEFVLPKRHKLAMSSVSGQTLGIYSESVVEGDRKVCVEGSVIHRGEMKSVDNVDYMRLKKLQVVKASKPNRVTEMLSRAVANVYKPKSDHIENIEYERKKKEEGKGKRSRDEPKAVKEILFAAFEKHQYWNVRDLQKTTDQPITFLKEILKEIAQYNTKNPHKNTWELKPEYRHYKS